MGNIVAGEALRLAAQSGQPVVNTYVASQAALTAHLYDGSITADNNPDALLQFEHYNHPEVPDGVEPAQFNYGPQTPNIDGNWLAGNSGGAARRINFYNPNDYALAQPRWEYDQIAKPQKINEEILNGNPVYWFAGVPSSPEDFNALPPYGVPHYAPGSIDDYAPWNHFYVGKIIGSFPVVYYYVGTPLDIMNNLQHRYQVMAHASEARAKALGALSVKTLTGNTDLTRTQLPLIWPEDAQDQPPFQYTRHKWHSAQFRMNNMQQQGYWRALLSKEEGFGIKIP
jgi:hypothetical protein